jgi:hypothetical protein
MIPLPVCVLSMHCVTGTSSPESDAMSSSSLHESDAMSRSSSSLPSRPKLTDLIVVAERMITINVAWGSGHLCTSCVEGLYSVRWHGLHSYSPLVVSDLCDDRHPVQLQLSELSSNYNTENHSSASRVRRDRSDIPTQQVSSLHQSRIRPPSCCALQSDRAHGTFCSMSKVDDRSHVACRVTFENILERPHLPSLPFSNHRWPEYPSGRGA